MRWSIGRHPPSQLAPAYAVLPNIHFSSECLKTALFATAGAAKSLYVAAAIYVVPCRLAN